MRTKISTETWYLFEQFDEREAVRIIAEAGFDCIDFSFTGEYKALAEETEDGKRALYRKAEALRAYAEGLGVTFNQAHAPFSTRPGDTRRFDWIVRSFEMASILGVKQIVVHPMHYMTYKKNEAVLKQANYEFFKALLPHAERNNVKIAIENMYQWDAKRKFIIHDTCASPKEFCEYVDMLDSPWVIACLDVGHCALVGEEQPEMIHTLGHDRLRALHVHDVDYLHDNHTLPGILNLDFDEIVKALAEIGYEGEFTLEANHFFDGFGTEFAAEAARFMAVRARFLADKLDAYRNADAAGGGEA